mmetsp:Transcript_5773/g.12600  ORF Transcript_5773/g.12600 Transcript_5773/m.12600 type:complete len:201 (-) Transcript_5773:74-676(-)
MVFPVSNSPSPGEPEVPEQARCFRPYIIGTIWCLGMVTALRVFPLLYITGSLIGFMQLFAGVRAVGAPNMDVRWLICFGVISTLNGILDLVRFVDVVTHVPAPLLHSWNSSPATFHIDGKDIETAMPNYLWNVDVLTMGALPLVSLSAAYLVACVIQITIASMPDELGEIDRVLDAVPQQGTAQASARSFTPFSGKSYKL